MKFLTTYPTRTDAEILASKLRDNDITVLVTADDAGGMYPTEALGGAQVFVSQKQYDKAKILLDNHE